MANYYKMLQNYVDANDLKGKKLTMNDFEQRMTILFGFGGRYQELYEYEGILWHRYRRFKRPHRFMFNYGELA